jgi:prephenate dehydratase
MGEKETRKSMRALFRVNGAYSEEAGLAYYGQAQMVPYESFADVFDAVAKGDCPAGLIPIENSLAGSIHQNYDLLLAHNLFIVGETFLRVRHCLIGFPDTDLSGIRRVISHPQALGQCVGHLREMGLKSEAVYDTAGSVKLLKENGDRTCAAIASRRAAGIYGMCILREGVEDNPENYTRFLEIAPQAVHPANDAKTSIVFSLKNEPGTLYNALRVFAERGIDLTKMESRPLVGKVWEYLFYIDFIGSNEEQPGRGALKDLQSSALMLRVLGCYPRYHEKAC